MAPKIWPSEVSGPERGASNFSFYGIPQGSKAENVLPMSEYLFRMAERIRFSAWLVKSEAVRSEQMETALSLEAEGERYAALEDAEDVELRSRTKPGHRYRPHHRPTSAA